MAFCNPREEFSALLCNIPSGWRDAISEALECVLSVKRDGNETCDSVKKCQTVTHFEPIKIVNNTLTFTYVDSFGIVHVRNIDLTPIINNALNSVDPKCLMTQEEWNALPLGQKFAAIYSKVCCVYTSCCGCEDCIDCENSCACKQYLTDGTPPYTISYKDCETKLPVTVEVTESNLFEFCAMQGSVSIEGDANYVDTGDCGAIEETTTTTTTTSSSTTTTTTEATTTTTTTSTTSTTTAATTTTSTTTTSTSTTTTTTASAFTYYLADEYLCNDCSIFNSNITVRLPASHVVQVGKFYRPVIFAGLVYNILSSTPQPNNPHVPLSTNNFTTCAGACI